MRTESHERGDCRAAFVKAETADCDSFPGICESVLVSRFSCLISTYGVAPKIHRIISGTLQILFDPMSISISDYSQKKEQ